MSIANSSRVSSRLLSSRLLGSFICRLLKKTQRRSTRTSLMADNLWHTVATYEPYAINHMPYANCSELIERHEAYKYFNSLIKKEEYHG